MTHEEKVIHPADRELMFSVALAEQISNFFPAFEGEVGVANKMGLLKWIMGEYRKAVASAEKKGREEGYKAYQTDHEPWKSGHIVGWNEAISAAVRVALVEAKFQREQFCTKERVILEVIVDKIKEMKK